MEESLFHKHLINGEKQAIEELVIRNRDKVYRTCLAYVQNKPDAEDLTQETFIKVLEKINQFKGESKISSWLIKIVINLSLNFLRDNKKRLQQLDISEIQITDDLEISNKDTRKMVRYAIYKLPEKQRKVFVLSYYIEMSYKEIEEITGFSISSIESLLFRARKKLRELLQDFYDELRN